MSFPQSGVECKAHTSEVSDTAHLLRGPATVMQSARFLREYGRLAYPPGEIYEYSNIGYEALGAIAEQLTGQTFGRVLEEQVLVPLGIDNSFFSDDTSRLPTAAAQYDAHALRISPYRTSTPPSGELYASAHDLARYLLLQLRRVGLAPAVDIRGFNTTHTRYVSPRIEHQRHPQGSSMQARTTSHATFCSNSAESVWLPLSISEA